MLPLNAARFILKGKCNQQHQRNVVVTTHPTPQSVFPNAKAQKLQTQTQPAETSCKNDENEKQRPPPSSSSALSVVSFGPPVPESKRAKLTSDVERLVKTPVLKRFQQLRKKATRRSISKAREIQRKAVAAKSGVAVVAAAAAAGG